MAKKIPVKIMDVDTLPETNNQALITMTLNGRAIKTDAPPYIENGRTMVPVRFISEALGADVAWDGSVGLVSITANDGTLITLNIDDVNLTIMKSGLAEIVSMDVPATIREGRTYVPVRYIAEALELSVDWNADKRTVILTTVL
jgi:hypothetical protein